MNLARVELLTGGFRVRDGGCGSDPGRDGVLGVAVIERP